MIWCEGCGSAHAFHTEQTNRRLGAIWKFNGNMVAPTFTPSMLVKSGHYVDGKRPCWCDYHKKPDAKPDAPTCFICHSFVTDGKMQFLSDCTHELAGQTVRLKPF